MKRDVDLLFELGTLRFLQRQWTRFLMPNVANLADHHFRVAWLALTIAEREGKPFDAGKILMMALVHDVAESRTNDADYLSRQYVERHEDEGAADMLEGTSAGQTMLAALHEYEKRESWEAKIVKDADNLDVDMELCEQASMGHQLPAEWHASRVQVADTQLFTKSARKLFDEIYATSPQRWHIEAPRNRFHGGDWKKEPLE